MSRYFNDVVGSACLKFDEARDDLSGLKALLHAQYRMIELGEFTDQNDLLDVIQHCISSIGNVIETISEAQNDIDLADIADSNITKNQTESDKTE